MMRVLLLFLAMVLFISSSEPAWADDKKGNLTPKKAELLKSNSSDEERADGVHKDINTFNKNVKTVTVKGYKKTTGKVKKLKGGKKYYVKIRTYKTIKGEKYYSTWSKAATVKTAK